MALLSRKVDYALLILSYLHHKGQEACAREIAERFALSRPFTANILKLLCHEGLVRSHRGVHGGYALARRAEDVCLCELAERIDGPIRLAPCNRPDRDTGACAVAEVCPVRGAIAEVDRRIRDVLASVTLADLFRQSHPEACTQFGLEVALRAGT
jgi:Rrf2 family protein